MREKRPIVAFPSATGPDAKKPGFSQNPGFYEGQSPPRAGSPGSLMSNPELCVIFNPVAGRQRAAGRLEKIRRGWGERVEFRPTSHPGHAIELAQTAAREGYRIIA